jgi:4-hydroxythreonine-4-phosphate dehydrogenase
MRTKKPILIVAAEPFGIFSEILFKTFKNYKHKRPLVIIGSYKLFINQMKFLKYNIPFNNINKNFNIDDLQINKINLINVNLKFSKPFEEISNNSNSYNEESFNLALSLMKKKIFVGLINGPISKKHFLKKKFLGITEYLAKKTNTLDYAMLIYNKSLSVSPITTHVPLKKVSNLITKKKIINHVKLINKFYRKNFNKEPVIAVTGLNPHCESYVKSNEEEKIIIPAIRHLIKKKFKVSGPYSADSLFIKNNINKFDVVLGMYHDQVLTPIKSIYNFDAINITLGLPFIRITPDHGPNSKMKGKNESNPESLISAIKFMETQ